MNAVAQKALNKRRKARLNETKRLQAKLIRVLSNAGLAYSSWISLVKMVDQIPQCDTAAWVYNEKTRQEEIWFARHLVKSLTVELLILVLRHEMLHKSMYRGLDKVGCAEIMNFALDACINKILWLSDPKGMAKLGRTIFPNNRSTIYAIMNPSVTTDERDEMEGRIQDIFDPIWWVPMSGLTNGKTCNDYHEVAGVFGNNHIPDPLNLYNRIAAILTPKEKEEIKKNYRYVANSKKKPNDGGKKVRGGKNKQRAADRKTIKEEHANIEAVKAKIKRQEDKQSKNGKTVTSVPGSGFSTFENIDDYFKQQVYDKKAADPRDINDFVSRIETWRQVEGVTDSIYRKFRSRVAVEPYPANLTRTGFDMMALGFNEEIPIYFNTVQDDDGASKKISCYFDTSPSMNSYVPFMVWMAEFFDSSEECTIAGGEFNGRYGFSGKVVGIPANAWDDFKKGKVRGGCSTSFEAVIKHGLEHIENDDVDVLMVFTDGESGLSDETIERFNASGKKCYSIYFAHEFDHRHQRQGQDPNVRMTSDLDKLNGESFTIWCPQEVAA